MLERFAPKQHVSRLTHLDPSALLAQGLAGLVLDLDNTITAWNSLEVPADIEQWVAQAKKAGLGVCIVSNSSKARRVRALAERLEVPALARPFLKPWGPGYRWAAEMLGTAPSATAAVGDQLFTDVYGGNRAGLHTILVHPLGRNEFFGTKVVRLCESVLRMLLRRRGLLADLPAEATEARAGGRTVDRTEEKAAR
ncbi:MAG: YqeG family HAD IIIA-type phosphatase [Armatimonadota bacterium]